MIWAPFALAVLFGLIVSAGIYFTIMWPDIEPEDPDHDAAGAADDAALHS
jgi:hypothetical protein